MSSDQRNKAKSAMNKESAYCFNSGQHTSNPDHTCVESLNEPMAQKPYPKLVIEIVFPYEGGIDLDELVEALDEAKALITVSFAEHGKIINGETLDALDNEFLSWRLEEPGMIGETPSHQGARLVLEREGLPHDKREYAISCIKALRNQWPDLGLRGAKDLYDSLRRENV